jgi:hypothetical protein
MMVDEDCAASQEPISRLFAAPVLAAVVEVAVNSLRPGTSLRDAGVRRDHLDRLVATGGDWPPLLVMRDGLDVVDGQHRLAAAIELKLETTRAVLYDGPPEDALVEAIRANVTHGLPLTLSERKRAAVTLVSSHQEWSDRMIANTCAISAATVSKLRAMAECSPDSHFVAVTRRLGADGKYRPASREELRNRIAEAIAARPSASLRAIAEVAGCSPATVRAVRKSIYHYQPRQSREGQAPQNLGPTQPDTGAAVKIWRSDSACASVESSDRFAEWFDRTRVEPSECSLHMPNVPLSRVYEVADEALGRSKLWSDFAAALQRRCSGRG